MSSGKKGQEKIESTKTTIIKIKLRKTRSDKKGSDNREGRRWKTWSKEEG